MQGKYRVLPKPPLCKVEAGGRFRVTGESSEQEEKTDIETPFPKKTEGIQQILETVDRYERAAGADDESMPLKEPPVWPWSTGDLRRWRGEQRVETDRPHPGIEPDDRRSDRVAHTDHPVEPVKDGHQSLAGRIGQTIDRSGEGAVVDRQKVVRAGPARRDSCIFRVMPGELMVVNHQTGSVAPERPLKCATVTPRRPAQDTTQDGTIAARDIDLDDPRILLAQQRRQSRAVPAHAADRRFGRAEDEDGPAHLSSPSQPGTCGPQRFVYGVLNSRTSTPRTSSSIPCSRVIEVRYPRSPIFL